MKLHSKTELASFFAEGVIVSLREEWKNTLWVSLIILAAFIDSPNVFANGFFAGVAFCVTCFFTTWIGISAWIYKDKKKWRESVYCNNVTGQKYTLVLPPSVEHDIHSVARQIKGQF